MARVGEGSLEGRVVTRGLKVALLLAVAMLACVAVRLVSGLGALTALNDGYPWGLWKPLHVVTFTGAGAGALGVALVTHVANRGRSHPLVRSAVLVGAITYTLAAFSVLVDLGRWWKVWALLVPGWWSAGSAVLVALCVMACALVLWAEVWIPRRFPLVASVALVLPFLHQASLGSLFLVAGTKLHPLWHTAWLPALFLLSCLSMGFGAVIVIDNVAALASGRARDARLDATLVLAMAASSLAFVALRAGEVLWAGELAAVEGPKGLLFLVEIALFAYPAIRLLAPSYRRNRGYAFWAAQLTVAAGALYRFDTYLSAYDPGPGFRYFPSLGEVLFSAGLAGSGLAFYLVLVKVLPVVAGLREPVAPALEPRGNAPACRTSRLLDRTSQC